MHDQSQLELCFDYLAHPATLGLDPEDVESPDYGVEITLVTPASLAIASGSYPKEHFYRDLVNHCRLHTPDLHCDDGIAALDDYLRLDLDLRGKERLSRRVVHELRLFANHINARLKRCFHGDTPRPDAAATLVDVAASLRKFRERYAPHLRGPSLLLDAEVRAALLDIEEYTSTRVHSALLRAMHLSADLRRALEAEERWQREALGGSIGATADQASLEQLHHRQGYLKKFVAQALHLQRRTVRHDAWYRNVVAAAGAGIAATFAQFTQVQATAAQGATDFGLRFASLLVLAVVAYVFKDRIKELSKEYLATRMQNLLPDRRVFLDYTRFAANGAEVHVPVARFDEAVHYFPASQLDEELDWVARQLPEPVALQPGAHVIRYTKRLAVRPRALAELGVSTLSLKDIFRLNISEFLDHLDDPTKDLAAFDGEDGVLVLRAPKVYYLDLLIRTFASATMNDEIRTIWRLDAARLVLHKQGIVRLDRPIDTGRFGYELAEAPR